MTLKIILLKQFNLNLTVYSKMTVLSEMHTVNDLYHLSQEGNVVEVLYPDVLSISIHIQI